jgi:hypothetical protein
MLHIVDDEAVVRDALSWLATSRAIPARAYESGLHFLAQIGTALRPDGDGAARRAHAGHERRGGVRPAARAAWRSACR